MSKPPPKLESQQLRVLLVDEERVLADHEGDDLSHPSIQHVFAITSVQTLEGVMAILGTHHFDAVKIVATTPTTYEHANAILSSIWQFGEDTAVLVVVNDEDVGWEMIRRGAQDFLTPEEAFGPSATRRIRAAVARQKWREDHQVAFHHRELDLEGPHVQRPTISSRIYEVSPLKIRARATFDGCVVGLVGLLKRAYAARLSAIELNLSEELAELGAWMGKHHATPRDVVHVHKNALAESLNGVRESRHRGVREEARLLLLGLMAKLASYYRLNTQPDAT
ncbi:MAG: hypothetical protein ACFCD0_04915 [Gemmataceae bacterium]